MDQLFFYEGQKWTQSYASAVLLWVFCVMGRIHRRWDTFDALRASWWGAGSGWMNRVHLTESWGPFSSLLQSWCVDQSYPFHTQSHPPPTSSPPWHPQSVSTLQLSVWQSAKSSQWNPPHSRSIVRLKGLISTDSIGEPSVHNCEIFWLISSVQSSGATCRFLPAKSINTTSGSNCEVIRERRLQLIPPLQLCLVWNKMRWRRTWFQDGSANQGLQMGWNAFRYGQQCSTSPLRMTADLTRLSNVVTWVLTPVSYWVCATGVCMTTQCPVDRTVQRAWSTLWKGYIFSSTSGLLVWNV